MDTIITAMLNMLFTLDSQLLLFIQNHLRFDTLTPGVIIFTKLGNMGLLWIVLSVVLLIPKRTRRAGLISLLALAGSFCVTNLFLKNYVDRVRPYEVLQGLTCLVGKASDASFPSGHASAAFASAVAIYKSTKKWLGVPVVIVAILISLSRLYVGIHYPSDVVCGAIIGGLIGLVMFWLFGERAYKKRARRRR